MATATQPEKKEHMAKDSALSADTLQKVEDLLNYEQKLVEKPPEEEEKVPEKDPNYVKILKHFGEHVGTELWLDYYGDLEKIKIQHINRFLFDRNT